MKSKLIIAGVITLLCLVGLFVVIDQLQYKTVSFVLREPAVSADIFHQPDGSGGGYKLQTITSSTDLRLKKGHYSYQPIGDNANTSRIDFMVNDSMTVTIDPHYSDQFLRTKTDDERAELTRVISEKYPSAMQTYEVSNALLFHKADWAGVVLSPRGMNPNDPTVFYRALLHKTNGVWQIVAKPQIVLTIHNTPSVDRQLLHQVNKLAL